MVFSFSKYQQTDAVYVNNSKASDEVSHSHLKAKLKPYGIDEPLLSKLNANLRGRASCVRYRGVFSESFIVESGVLQGSLLVPYLFNVFLRDINKSWLLISTSCK